MRQHPFGADKTVALAEQSGEISINLYRGV
jgi:hypothetical protein